mmetsp:Transcript_21669/g.21822  ORF Transcript_21669/g.21822 Transcript_21669/m.21822 type:complete len:93 (+) Transcript_21669:982-1260(+)
MLFTYIKFENYLIVTECSIAHIFSLTIFEHIASKKFSSGPYSSCKLSSYTSCESTSSSERRKNREIRKEERGIEGGKIETTTVYLVRKKMTS